jgi:hypothetical protein
LELEKIATKKIASKIPNMDNLNSVTEVVNTGNIRVSIGEGSGAVNIKEDISLFDLAFN